MTQRQTFTFDPQTNCELALLSRSDNYIDASVAVQYVIYKWNVSTGVETNLDIDQGNGGVVPEAGQTRYHAGQGTFEIAPATQERMRYKVRGGYVNEIPAFVITGGAWTDDL